MPSTALQRKPRPRGGPGPVPSSRMAGMTDARRRADMFVDPEQDPRENGPRLGDERATLVEFLRTQRLTLEMKCAGLEATDLARRSVEPSTMSLLGLVRHMADVERAWLRRRMARQDAPPLYWSDADPDGEFDGVEPDPALVEEAWERWREERAFTDRFVAEPGLLGMCSVDGYGRP